MVRSQRSPGRKSCPSLLHRQSNHQMRMETDVTDPQHMPSSPPTEDTVAFTPTRPWSPSLSDKCDGKVGLVDIQGRDDGSSQVNTKWRPIPPLLPEPEHLRSGTKDQSCQTEEQFHTTGHCVEPGDPPLLQQPLHTSKSGIQQIIECFRSGTSQLKNMLLKEVDTIFECKLCRSLFRGLPNLITHKEYYCLSRLPETDGSADGDKQTVAVKELLDAIYPRADRPDFVVRLEPIQTSTKAVFQYLTTEEELARYPSQTPSARESPVAWEGQSLESVDNKTPSHPVGSESQNNPSQTQKRWEPDEEPKEEPPPPPPEDEESNSGVEDVTISCCLCGQDFNSRRSIRRHCRKMHQTKLEELRKFTETRTVPTSLLSMVKGRTRTLSTPTGKSCPVCLKTFATKANVRRHFDEVHRGLRRDNITPSVSPKPSQPLTSDDSSPKKSSSASPTRSHSSKPAPVSAKTPVTSANTLTKAPNQSQTPASTQANPTSCRCTLCKRTYSSQLMLKRHMRIVHKIYSSKNRPTTAPTAPTAPSNNTTPPSNNTIQVKEEAVEPSDEEEEEGDVDSSPAPSPSDSTGTVKSVPPHNALKVKEEEIPPSPKPPPSSTSSALKMKQLSVGFDFKQLFCKLCKRQFSSRQNLSKHIELHTDGTDIFIKFYRCPLCRYESRRKRDVLRHVTVVHKKSSSYLAKIMPKLESRAVKRQAETVLNNPTPNKRTNVKEEVNGRHCSSPSPSPPVTRKHESTTSTTNTPTPSSSTSPHPVQRKHPETSSAAAFSPSTPVTRKQDRQHHSPSPISPPLTRRSDKHSHQRSISPHTHRPDTHRQDTHRPDSPYESTGSTEVRVTKNFSLHACDQCGRAFAKKLYLESHKRSHRNAATAAASRRKTAGVNTRSRSLIW